jgi:nitrate/nitrite-specific signal transduction histidine kinase
MADSSLNRLLELLLEQYKDLSEDVSTLKQDEARRQGQDVGHKVEKLDKRVSGIEAEISRLGKLVEDNTKFVKWVFWFVGVLITSSVGAAVYWIKRMFLSICFLGFFLFL